MTVTESHLERHTRGMRALAPLGTAPQRLHEVLDQIDKSVEAATVTESEPDGFGTKRDGGDDPTAPLTELLADAAAKTNAALAAVEAAKEKCREMRDAKRPSGQPARRIEWSD